MVVSEGLNTNWAERGFYLCLGSAAGLLMLLAAISGQPGLALAALAVGAAWWVAHRLGWWWLAPVAFTIFVGCAVSGLLRQLPAAGLVVSVALALATWDLDGFSGRLGRFQPHPDRTQFVRNHLARLLAVLVLGVALGEAALILRLSMGLGWMAVLGLLAVIILLQALQLLGSETEGRHRGDHV